MFVIPKFGLKQSQLHDFFCMNCGNRSLSFFRPKSRLREIGHRKKLYCPHCKVMVNHVECRSQEDIWEFKQAFENGDFAEEAKASIDYIKENG